MLKTRPTFLLSVYRRTNKQKPPTGQMWLGMDEDKTSDTGMDNLAAGWAPKALHDRLMLVFYATNTTTPWQNNRWFWLFLERRRRSIIKLIIMHLFATYLDQARGSYYNLHAHTKTTDNIQMGTTSKRNWTQQSPLRKEYCRIIQELKAKNKNKPFAWMFRFFFVLRRPLRKIWLASPG